MFYLCVGVAAYAPVHRQQTIYTSDGILRSNVPPFSQTFCSTQGKPLSTAIFHQLPPPEGVVVDYTIDPALSIIETTYHSRNMAWLRIKTCGC
jgi:hypothetical protein